MIPYQIIDHPSELRLRIQGQTKEDLFINAVNSLSSIITGRSIPEDIYDVIRTVKLTADNLELLLVDLLNEILSLSQINHCGYWTSQLTLESINGQHNLEVMLFSLPIERFMEDIKAVTYQDIKIKQVDNLWETLIVCDI